MGQVYRAGVIGAGSGGKLSLKGLAESDRYELVAVSDIAPAALREATELYPQVRPYGDHRRMLAECALDVVCVATWPPSHRAVSEDALGAGLRGILVEKPLGDTWQAGRGVIDAVAAAGIPIVVPHGLLVADHGRAILDLVAQGAIGPLKVVEIELTGRKIIVHFGWPMSSWLDRMAIGVMVFKMMRLPRMFPQFDFDIKYRGGNQ